MVSDIPANVLPQAVNCARSVTKKNFAIHVSFPLLNPKIPIMAAAKAKSWKPSVRL